MVRQVIIGNSAAGLSAIKAIRQVDLSCPITLISAENYIAYSPVLLTYYLKGNISREDLFVVDSDFYELNRVITKFGSEAVAVDPFKQTVHLKDRAKVEYDNLLIATGASPIIPSISQELDNVFSLRTIKDAEKILKCAKTAKEIIIVGAGLIGLQVADALLREQVKLTIIEWARQVFPESIDADCAALSKKSWNPTEYQSYWERR